MRLLLLKIGDDLELLVVVKVRELRRIDGRRIGTTPCEWAQVLATWASTQMAMLMPENFPNKMQGPKTGGRHAPNDP
jgi:hypothetical protein